VIEDVTIYKLHHTLESKGPLAELSPSHRVRGLFSTTSEWLSAPQALCTTGSVHHLPMSDLRSLNTHMT